MNLMQLLFPEGLDRQPFLPQHYHLIDWQTAWTTLFE